MRQHLTNLLLLLIAVLLALNFFSSPSRVGAASGRVRVVAVDKSKSVDVDGEVVGFSCVNKGAYTECSIAVR